MDKQEKLSKLRDLRIQRGLTQEKVAKQMGVSRVTYTRWECGLVSPSIQEVIKLADFFGVSVDCLLGRTE